MTIPIHSHLVRHGPGARVRITLNGFVLRTGSTDSQDALSGVTNHLLVPGENVLDVEVLGDPGGSTALVTAEVRGSDDVAIAYLGWPDATATKELPWVQRATFTPEPGVPAPMWLDAPEVEVPREGTPELWKEIRALSRAFEEARGADVYDAFSLKAEDTHRMLELPWSRPSETQKLMLGTLDKPWRMAPIPEDDVVFRTFGGGRLVEATRLSGAPLFHAERLGDPTEEPVEMTTNPVFMRHDGRFRIIR